MFQFILGAKVRSFQKIPFSMSYIYFCMRIITP